MNTIAFREPGFALDRRKVLKGSAAGLVVCFTLGVDSHDARAAGGAMLGAYLQIAPDSSVTVYVGSSDMGQGILTGLAMLVAEELMLDWSAVNAVHAPAAAAYANPIFHLQLTGGSTSMRGWFTPRRQAAAIAREMLITAGAAALKQPRTACTASKGAVHAGPLSVPYGAIVAAAAALTPPAAAPLVTTYKVIGQRLQRKDIPAKVNGSAVFGIDVKVPGMVHAAIVHAPAIGATVANMPATPPDALALVNLGNAVGVVASNTWDAMRIADGLSVQWTTPAIAATINSATILAAANTLMSSGTPQVIETSGTPDAALAGAASKIDATYHLPYLAHACMEVLNCTASVTPTSCEIWAPTQGQGINVFTASALTGLSPAQIKINTTYLGGGLGRKFEQDFVAEAIRISKAIGKPVKLTWSREQDFKHDKYRPTALIRVRAGLDGAGKIAALIHRNVAASIDLQNGSTQPDAGGVSGATGLPYAIANRRIEFVPNPAPVPVGYWRSVGESYNTFAIESAIDELALASHQDPMAFRQKLLASKPRELAVINAVAALSNWSSPPPGGTARGVAFMSGFGSLIAEVVEISLDTAGKIRVNKVFVVIDCGTAVNPDSVEAQMQGGVAHGLSAALWGEVKFTAGAANVANFDTYRMAKMTDMPTVTVKIVNSGAPIGGIGEVGVPCVAPAIANAYAKLTGARIRALPFYPGATMGGL